MNSVIGPSFKVVFAEKKVLADPVNSAEPTIFQQNTGTHEKRAFQMHT